LSTKQRVVIRNGIDIEAYRSTGNRLEILREYNIVGQFVALGLASQWTRMKGIEDFFKVMKNLDKKRLLYLLEVGLRGCREGILI
jgi:glycosyltransferase involved in cell wall biosynthesis